jgi:phosphate-selective porin
MGITRPDRATPRLVGQVVLIVLVVSFLSFSFPSFAPSAAAQTPSASVPTGPPAPVQGGKPNAPPRFEWAEHPTLRFGPVTLALRARFQTDFRRSDAPFENDFEVALKRVGVDGEIGNVLHFEVDRELDDPDKWKDVLVNYRQFDAVQLQAGKFKVPFGLDQTTSITNQSLVYRSLAGQRLAPARDKGVMVHGRVVNRTIRYELGMFEHDGRTAQPSLDSDRVQAGRTLAGHVAVVPFRSTDTPLSDLLVGAAFTRSDVPEGFPTIRGRTHLGALFYESDHWVKGRRERRGAEFRWRPGPFSIQAEYVRVTDQRLGQSVEDGDLTPFPITGWYVLGTWAITGERKADGVERAKRPLFQGGGGAFEIAFRVEELKFGRVVPDELPSTSPRADVMVSNANRVVTAGLSWHPNRWVKVQFNLIRDTMSDPEMGPLPAQPSYWSRVLRLQFIV